MAEIVVKFPNIKKEVEELKEKSRRMAYDVEKVFREAIERSGKVCEVQPSSKDDLFYSIDCGVRSDEFFRNRIDLCYGKISLYRTSFGSIDAHIISWNNIETFRKEIMNHFK